MRQIGHLTGLVDDLLDVSRVTRGLISTEMVVIDIKQVIADAIEQSAPLIKSRQHQISTDLASEEIRILGDHKRMVQVLTNLLTNAAKYTPVNGNIIVHLSTEDDSVLVAVSDDGIGITPELLPRVFELFTQAERTIDRSQGGLGIGLALVKSLVELHGGNVRAISHPTAKGSRFEIRLPRINAETIETQPLLRAIGNEKKVLIVDDNEDAANMLALLLQTSGHSVNVVYTAQDAIGHVTHSAPEVILLDIGLPEIDGNALARRFRSMPSTADTLIVAVTGYGAEENRREALAAGFDEHLVKPIDIVQLENLFLKS